MKKEEFIATEHPSGMYGSELLEHLFEIFKILAHIDCWKSFSMTHALRLWQAKITSSLAELNRHPPPSPIAG